MKKVILFLALFTGVVLGLAAQKLIIDIDVLKGSTGPITITVSNGFGVVQTRTVDLTGKTFISPFFIDSPNGNGRIEVSNAYGRSGMAIDRYLHTTPGYGGSVQTLVSIKAVGRERPYVGIPMVIGGGNSGGGSDFEISGPAFNN